MNMKKGISIWAFGKMPLKTALPIAKAAGFEGVELALAESGELNLESTREEVLAVKALMEENALELYSVATSLFWQYPLTSSDPVIREKAEKIARKLIEVASWLGCDTVLVVPGTVEDSVPYDIAYDRSLRAIKELAPFAQEHGVVVGIENVWNKLLLSPLEMRDFIDAVGSPWVKAYFDVGNVLKDGYPQHWIRILGERIAKVHIKDFKCSVGTLAGFVDLWEGDVNYPAVIAELQKVGYDNWLTGELFPAGDRELIPWIQQISKSMDRIIEARS